MSAFKKRRRQFETPECKSCGSDNVVTDTKQGHMVCDDCGVILESGMISASTEYRNFSESDKPTGECVQTVRACCRAHRDECSHTIASIPRLGSPYCDRMCAISTAIGVCRMVADHLGAPITHIIWRYMMGLNFRVYLIVVPWHDAALTPAAPEVVARLGPASCLSTSSTSEHARFFPQPQLICSGCAHRLFQQFHALDVVCTGFRRPNRGNG